MTYSLLEKNNLKDAYIRPLIYCEPNMTLVAPETVSYTHLDVYKRQL